MAEPRSTVLEEPIPETTPPPEERVPGAIAADALREYISAGGFSPAVGDYFRTLPRLVDDVEREIGADTYERMLQDPQIFSDVSILKQAVISQDLVVAPPVKEDDPQIEQAKEIAAFCERNLARLKHFRTETLYDMLDAVAFGHRLAEITFEVAERGPDKGKLCLQSVKTKPRTSYAFVVDSYMNLLGVVGQIPGRWAGSVSGMLAYSVRDLTDIPNLVPRGKLAVLSLLTRNGDPRGIAWLRVAYNSWFLKTQIWPEYLKYLSQFAGPSLIGTTAEHAQPAPQFNPDGTPATDDTGRPIVVTAESRLLTELLTYRNSTALVVPFGTTITSLFQYTTGEAFRFAVDLFNHEINQGLLFQSLATMEASFGSRAASQVHQDILELPIQYVRTCCEEMIQRDLFAPLVALNYGEDALPLTPRANLGDTEEQNFAVKGATVARLETSGYFDPSQYPALDTELGLPRRTPEEAEARKQMKLAAAEALKAEAAAPPKPGQAPAAASQAIPKTEQNADARA